MVCRSSVSHSFRRGRRTHLLCIVIASPLLVQGCNCSLLSKRFQTICDHGSRLSFQCRRFSVPDVEVCNLTKPSAVDRSLQRGSDLQCTEPNSAVLTLLCFVLRCAYWFDPALRNHRRFLSSPHRNTLFLCSTLIRTSITLFYRQSHTSLSEGTLSGWSYRRAYVSFSEHFRTGQTTALF